MKSRITKLLLVFVMFLAFGGKASAAVQTDPVLTSAIITQMELLKKLFNRRDSTQKKIIAAEGAVTLAMDRMHKVENKVLGYMANVQVGFQNLYQLKHSAELVAIEIPKNMGKLRGAVRDGGFQGTALSIVIGEELTNITTEMMSLYPFMAQLVSSGTINVGSGEYDKDGKEIMNKKKVNLLDSAERYYICSTIESKLENINTALYLLAWEIRTLKWRDLLYELDPDGWNTIMATAGIAKGIVWDWNMEMRYW